MARVEPRRVVVSFRTTEREGALSGQKTLMVVGGKCVVVGVCHVHIARPFKRLGVIFVVVFRSSCLASLQALRQIGRRPLALCSRASRVVGVVEIAENR